MKFGSVDNPEEIDFTLPRDHKDTKAVLQKSKGKGFEAYVGCSKWNKKDIKGFYPRGTKDELGYYSQHFNSIELNALAYGRKPPEVVQNWYDTTTPDFRFFPKFSQAITHYRRLNNVDEYVENFVISVSNLKEKLGGLFLQLNANFSPKDMDRVIRFVENWAHDIPLAAEFRHTDWYNDPSVAGELFEFFEKFGVTNVIVDTAGRRDLMHMRLTTPTAFVRYVGANHKSDYERLDDWITRIAKWKKLGLKELCFFIHQNIEKESPLLSAYFIEKLNKKTGTDLNVPKTL
ncbi:MAG: DUF72 domain-containing protein [Pyrinomonadaceae bacterium]|nr:DUF72 domain-containing protein [Pyrinomonadaceae bacterium]